MRRIPVSGPWVTDRETRYVADAAQHGWYEAWDTYNQKFESAFAREIGVPYAIAVNSCTAAIHLSLAAFGIGPGDEVIVPDITWIASAGPVTYLGATPVFADIDPVTWCLDAASVEERITPRTKAIVAVDLYGGLPDWTALRAVADRHGLRIVEDAAEAIGTTLFDRRAGAFGDTGVFSFHGTKTMTTGEGGMLVTSDEQVYRRCLKLRDQGRDQNARGRLWNDEVAFKYRMSGVQAALGLAQLERLPDLVGKKRQIFEWYLNGLGGLNGVTLNAEPEGMVNSYWMTTMLLSPEIGMTKEYVIEQLDAAEIDSRPFFYPLSSMPAFEGLPGIRHAGTMNPVAYRLSPYGVNLPSALRLTADDVDYVCATLRKLLGR